MFAAALSYLEEPEGPVAVAAVDGALAKALSLRADGDEDTAREVLQDLYAANPENAQVEEALTDTSFGIVPTSSDRIDARSDPWDVSTEPKPGDFVDPGAQERKAVLLSEAERELDEFIGLDEGQGSGRAAQERGGDGTGPQGARTRSGSAHPPPGVHRPARDR